MPYGLPKNLNTKDNEQWIEDCVKSLMEKNPDRSKEDAIKICKSRLIERKGNKRQANILMNREQ